MFKVLGKGHVKEKRELAQYLVQSAEDNNLRNITQVSSFIFFLREKCMVI